MVEETYNKAECNKMYNLHSKGVSLKDLCIIFYGELTADFMLEIAKKIRYAKKVEQVEFEKFIGNSRISRQLARIGICNIDDFREIASYGFNVNSINGLGELSREIVYRKFKEILY